MLMLIALPLTSMHISAQTSTYKSHNDSVYKKGFVSPFSSFYSQPDAKSFNLIPSNRKDLIKWLPQADLFYDSLYIRQILFQMPYPFEAQYYDATFRRYISNPLMPCGSVEGTLICGALNYLILFADKKHRTNLK